MLLGIAVLISSSHKKGKCGNFKKRRLFPWGLSLPFLLISFCVFPICGPIVVKLWKTIAKRRK
jgi:hypothetical protein